MILYRVEHPLTKLGPYVHTLENHAKNEDGMRGMVESHNSDIDFHPTPCHDGIKDFSFTGMLCAFFTTNALRNWFDGYLDLLHEEGFKLIEVDVKASSIRIGHIQVAYNPKHSRIVAVRELI